MRQRYEHLTEEQARHFLERGHVVLRECFSRERAREWTARAFRRLGIDPGDPATWTEARVHMPTATRIEVKELAPRAWGAICDLVGGEERIAQPCVTGDGFIINFQIGRDDPWQPPSPASPGWHKDGDFFRHFLDSPEQGLLTLFIWSDIEHRGGGTFVACDSVGPVARFLAKHPEGLHPREIDARSLVTECRDFIEFTGRAGDVVLLHPFVLHAHSPNQSGRPRFLTNPPVHLKVPMRFDRTAWEEHSLVEQAVLRALGVERFPFTPAAPRERIVPERVRRQQQMLEAEKARLGATG
jgi:hypothetical protein